MSAIGAHRTERGDATAAWAVHSKLLLIPLFRSYLLLAGYGWWGVSHGACRLLRAQTALLTDSGRRVLWFSPTNPGAHYELGACPRSNELREWSRGSIK
ncbi:hypothetical protein SBBP2_890014 [Burkholderiales bacterium]|nr:hypothetical protein SBBP2_890014 [Burkholderiales bacterium]